MDQDGPPDQHRCSVGRCRDSPRSFGRTPALKAHLLQAHNSPEDIPYIPHAFFILTGLAICMRCSQLRLFRDSSVICPGDVTRSHTCDLFVPDNQPEDDLLFDEEKLGDNGDVRVANLPDEDLDFSEDEEVKLVPEIPPVIERHPLNALKFIHSLNDVVTDCSTARICSFDAGPAATLGRTRLQFPQVRM
jgi:hypothetical protein